MNELLHLVDRLASLPLIHLDLLSGHFEQLLPFLCRTFLVSDSNEEFFILLTKVAHFFARVANDVIVVLDGDDLAHGLDQIEPLALENGWTIEVEVFSRDPSRQLWFATTLPLGHFSVKHANFATETPVKLILSPTLLNVINVRRYVAFLTNVEIPLMVCTLVVNFNRELFRLVTLEMRLIVSHNMPLALHQMRLEVYDVLWRTMLAWSVALSLGQASFDTAQSGDSEH